MFYSIVIPTYNRGHIISHSIESVLSQSFNDFEVLIIDDGSTDDTENIVKSFSDSRIKYIKNENHGVAHARNTGIKLSSGKYIGFLDSDDVMENLHLQTAFDFINSKSNPEVIHLNFLWGSRDRSVVQKNELPKSSPEDVFKACSLHVNCLFILNDIAKNNLFNESKELMFAEDWDFFIKLAVRYQICYLDKTTTYLIDHEERSMRDFDEQKWKLRRDALILSLKQDEIIQKSYLHKIKVVEAHMNSLIAIGLAVKKNKIKTLKYLLLSIKQNVNDFFSLRTLAIIKHLLFTW
ncbi:MAG: glycosyltransferase [Sphingobacteriaceae bacterium]|nr:glycosyltransferase [Sphingobacteriaceae bacterium]